MKTLKKILPMLGFSEKGFSKDLKPGKRRILLVAYFDPNGLSTIVENIEEWRQLSEFAIDILNLYFHPHPTGLQLPPTIDINTYDGLLIHCTASYNAANLFSLDSDSKCKIVEYSGLKILMKQDEQYRTNDIIEYLRSRSFDVLMTCVPESEIEKVYPRYQLRNLTFIHTLTGYVSKSLRAQGLVPERQRIVDVGYRGSLQPYYFGQLSYDKQTIGKDFEVRAAHRKLVTDISSRWEDRFMGRAWFEFLGSVKGVLGVESGASIFDFTGEIENQTKKFLRDNPNATFEEVFEKILKYHEGKINYAQVSPRHFEAAACRAAQILFEGSYSGIFVADRHYIPLRRDFSNIDEVVDTLLDDVSRFALVETSFEEIILNSRFSYEAFVGHFDEVIGHEFERKNL